jgi:hypothetical protein
VQCPPGGGLLKTSSSDLPTSLHRMGQNAIKVIAKVDPPLCQKRAPCPCQKETCLVVFYFMKFLVRHPVYYKFSI